LRRYAPLLIWAVPIAFLLAGHWPFGLMPALLITIWVGLSGRDRRS
jgi:hypothetical protein